MRRLDSRVYRLEKIGWSRPPRPCPSCGAPKGWVAGGIHVVDPEGRPYHQEFCPKCGIETSDGKAIDPVDPNEHPYREILVMPRRSAPLPV